MHVVNHAFFKSFICIAFDYLYFESLLDGAGWLRNRPTKLLLTKAIIDVITFFNRLLRTQGGLTKAPPALGSSVPSLIYY